jgi:hypothetical protein
MLQHELNLVSPPPESVRLTPMSVHRYEYLLLYISSHFLEKKIPKINPSFFKPLVLLLLHFTEHLQGIQIFTKFSHQNSVNRFTAPITDDDDEDLDTL